MAYCSIAMKDGSVRASHRALVPRPTSHIPQLFLSSMEMDAPKSSEPDLQQPSGPAVQTAADPVPSASTGPAMVSSGGGGSGLAPPSVGAAENAAELKFGPDFDDIHILSNAQVAVILQVSAKSAVNRDEELNDVYRKTQKYVERFNTMTNPEKDHQELVDELDNLQE